MRQFLANGLAVAILIALCASADLASAQLLGKHQWYLLGEDRTSAEYVDRLSLTTSDSKMPEAVVVKIYAQPQNLPQGQLIETVSYMIIDCAAGRARPAGSIMADYTDGSVNHPELPVPGWSALNDSRGAALEHFVCGKVWPSISLDGSDADLRKGYLDLISGGIIK